MQSGRPDDESLPAEISWGPVTVTFAGIPEIRPEWVARHLDELYILDVRQTVEFEGELGHVNGAHLIPLDELRERIDEIPRDQPIVSICQSGKRSAMAVQILLREGFQDVANVSGGLIQWSRFALPISDIQLPDDWSI